MAEVAMGTAEIITEIVEVVVDKVVDIAINEAVKETVEEIKDIQSPLRSRSKIKRLGLCFAGCLRGDKQK